MCEHETFEATVTFNRLTDTPGGPVTAIYVDARARCSACGHPVVWNVPDVGVAPDRPTVSPNGQELRVPCRVTPAAPS